MKTPPATTLAKGLRLLAAIAGDHGRTSLHGISQTLGMTLPTAHRLALTLVAEGFLIRARKGYYLPGPALTALGWGDDAGHTLAALLRRPLARLAQANRGFGHFGILEDGMVTYLVKETGLDGQLFTTERGQLEAYCSAVGKVLLAAMPAAELEAYLANGPFVALTERTITDPAALRVEVDTVRAAGIAFDRREIREDLFCIGIPVTGRDGTIVGGISISLLDQIPDAATIRRLRRELEGIAATAQKTLLAALA